MNQAMYDRAKQAVDDMTVKELYDWLTKAGFHVTIKELPEPKEKETP